MANDTNKEATDFLRNKGMIADDKEYFLIKGSFGEINLAELLMEFGMLYDENHDQGVYGQSKP